MPVTIPLAEKFRQIEVGGLAGAIPARDDQLSELRHKKPPGSMAGRYFFEPGSALGSNVILLPSDDISVFVGAHSYMNGGGYLRDGVLIGRYCSIGRRVTIAAGGHNMGALSTSPLISGCSAAPYSAAQLEQVRGRKGPNKPTVIESDVWIGDGAVIRPGVKLSVGTVVGANAVVVRDTDPYEIVGGVSAKTLGYRFAPQVIERLLASEWWEYDAATLNSLPTANVFQFLEELSSLAAQRSGFPTYVSAP